MTVGLALGLFGFGLLVGCYGSLVGAELSFVDPVPAAEVKSVADML